MGAYRNDREAMVFRNKVLEDRVRELEKEKEELEKENTILSMENGLLEGDPPTVSLALKEWKKELELVLRERGALRALQICLLVVVVSAALSAFEMMIKIFR